MDSTDNQRVVLMVCSAVLVALSLGISGLREARDDTGPFRDSPIHHAAWTGNARKVRALLLFEPSLVNAFYKDKGDEYTPLHLAALRGRASVVKVLLEYRADLWQASWWNGTALEAAVWNGHTEVAQLLLQHGANLDIFTASGLGMTERVNRFLDDDPELVSAQGHRGRTALHWAAARGQMPVAVLLLNRGADPNANLRKNCFDHRAPLHDAVLYGRRELAGLLLARGAKLDARNDMGQTPLHIAASAGRVNMAELLLHHGANVNAWENGVYEGPSGWDTSPTWDTPLRKALERDHEELAALLRKHGGIDEGSSRRPPSPVQR